MKKRFIFMFLALFVIAILINVHFAKQIDYSKQDMEELNQEGFSNFFVKDTSDIDTINISKRGKFDI